MKLILLYAYDDILQSMEHSIVYLREQRLGEAYKPTDTTSVTATLNIFGESIPLI